MYTRIFFRLNGACADLGSECPVRVHSDNSRMPLVLGNPHNPQRLTAILPKPGTNSSHPRYTQFPTPVHRMSNPGTQNVRFRYKGELHIRKQVLRCSGVELHKRVTGFVGQNFHKSVEIPPRRRRVPNNFLQLQAPQNNVWSAALPQAKNDGDRLVCANVFGLYWIAVANNVEVSVVQIEREPRISYTGGATPNNRGSSSFQRFPELHASLTAETGHSSQNQRRRTGEYDRIENRIEDRNKLRDSG